MHRVLPLLMLLFLLLPELEASCPEKVYYLTPGGETELVTLSAIDLNAGAEGVQSSLSAAPLQYIRGTVGWRFEELASGTVEVALTGDWSDGELAQLYTGRAIPGQSVISEFGFFAPERAGSYTLKTVFSFREGCATAYALSRLVVSNASPAVHVEILSPSRGKVFGRGEPVEIRALHTPGAEVALYINDTLMGRTLPYIWDTSGLPPGRYSIGVNISLANSSAAAQVEVELVNGSPSIPGQLVINLPESVRGVERYADGIVAVSEGKLYLLSPSGEMIAELKTAAPSLIAAGDSGFALAQGRLLSFYRGTQQLWNVTLPAEAQLIASSSDKIAVLAGGEVYLFNTTGALLWSKQSGISSALLDMSEAGIAVAGRSGVQLLSYNGSLLWNLTLEAPPADMAINSRLLLLLIDNELRAFSGGRLLWNRTLRHNASMVEASDKYLAVASPEDVVLYTAQSGEPLWVLSPPGGVHHIAMARDGAALLVLSGKEVISIPLLHEKPLKPWKALAGVLVAGVLVIVAVLLRRTRDAKSRVERASELRVKVTSTEGAPLGGAVVEAGDRKAVTDSSGEAHLRVTGRRSLRIEKEGFVPAEVVIHPGQEELAVELTPERTLTPGVEERLEELRRRVDEAHRRISGYDPCLPGFFRGAAHQIIDGAAALARNPRPGSGAVDAAEYTVSLLCEAMQDWKNVALYRSQLRDAGGCEAPPFDYTAAAELLGAENPWGRVKEKLGKVDRRLTAMVGEVSVHPPASLWKVARLLVERAEEAAEGEAAALCAYAAYLLECTIEMLEREELLMRLRRTLL